MSDADLRSQERSAQDDALALGRLAAMRARLGNRGPQLAGDVRAFFLTAISGRSILAILDEPLKSANGYSLPRGSVLTIENNGRGIRVPEWFLDGGAP